MRNCGFEGRSECVSQQSSSKQGSGATAEMAIEPHTCFTGKIIKLVNPEISSHIYSLVKGISYILPKLKTKKIIPHCLGCGGGTLKIIFLLSE